MQIKPSILAAQPFLKGMSERQLELLAKESMLAEFKADERILYQGGPANRFYIILEGRVELKSPVAGGEDVHIQTLGVGDGSVGRGYSRRISGTSTRARLLRSRPYFSTERVYANCARKIMVSVTN